MKEWGLKTLRGFLTMTRVGDCDVLSKIQAQVVWLSTTG